MRFLKLIGCDNGKIGSYAALVKERNDTAHTNGNIFFSTQAALDAKIAEILRVVDEIQWHSRTVIERCYSEFLRRSADPEEREYPDSADQIREVLIHGNYMSQHDIAICVGLDVEAIGDADVVDGARVLHEALVVTFGSHSSRVGV